jgi:hypothetical protein
MTMISHEIILNNAAEYWRNPRLPAVSLPLPSEVTPASAGLGSKLSERIATKQKAQILDLYLKYYTQEEIAEEIFGDKKKNTTVGNIIRQISETVKMAERPDSIQDYNLWELIKSLAKFPKLEKPPNILKPSTMASLTDDSATDGIISPRVSIYTDRLLKKTILRVMAHYNRFLRPLPLLPDLNYLLKTRVLTTDKENLPCRQFVTSKVNHKKQPVVETLPQLGKGNLIQNDRVVLYFSITK